MLKLVSCQFKILQGKSVYLNLACRSVLVWMEKGLKGELLNSGLMNNMLSDGKAKTVSQCSVIKILSWPENKALFNHVSLLNFNSSLPFNGDVSCI